jgi:hypothetical protein
MSKSIQNSKRRSSVQVEDAAHYLAVLGLSGKDARRLAQRIIEGSSGLSDEDYIGRLQYACRTTYGNTHKLFFRKVQNDLTIFGPKGYVIVDFVAGWVDFAYTYRKGQTFERATRLFSTEPTVTQDLPLAAE